MKYFAYCRRSEDDEGRQVLSIPAQRDEVERLLLKHDGMELIQVFEESRTAKAPGRPVFNEMMSRIERGEAEGIIAWHPDRLARNSIDGGQLIYQLDRGVLKDLKFSTYTFENSSQGKFMLQIMFGYSKYYVDSLSENVKRGNRRKLEQGILPNRPPIGYKNDPESRTIIPDPMAFATVRRIWELVLGGLSVRQVRDMADYQWGFRTPKRKRTGGTALTIGALYGLLSHEFYTGQIPWRGKLYPGKHVPMVTLDEFDRVRRTIGRQGRPAPQKHNFAYTGLMRCGTCGCAITAERQVNRYGYEYEYYHCTKKRRDISCPEPYVEKNELERQILGFLGRCRISNEIHDWAVEEISKAAAQHSTQDGERIAALRRAYEETERSLKKLTDLAVREMIEEADFVVRRDGLKARANRIRQQIASAEANPGSWLEPFHLLILFSNLAVIWFKSGNSDQKRLIVNSLGSNLTLSNKILSIQALDPFDRIPKSRDITLLCAVVDDVRTFLSDSAFEKRFASMRELAVQFKAAANDNEVRKAA